MKAKSGNRGRESGIIAAGVGKQGGEESGNINGVRKQGGEESAGMKGRGSKLTWLKEVNFRDGLHDGKRRKGCKMQLLRAGACTETPDSSELPNMACKKGCSRIARRSVLIHIPTEPMQVLSHRCRAVGLT